MIEHGNGVDDGPRRLRHPHNPHRLALVAARRAGQLKQGVPSTLTGKPIARADNAVTVALKELETGSGVRWGDDLPSTEAIRALVQREDREAATVYSVSRDEAGGDDRVGIGVSDVFGGSRRF